MLIIQPTLLISNLVIARYFSMWNMRNGPSKDYPKDLQLKRIFISKIRNYKKNENNIYVKSNYC